MNYLEIIKNNLIFIFLAIALASSAIVPFPNGSSLYVLGLAILFLVALYLNRKRTYKDYKYAIFYLVCILSSIGNMVFDIRLIIFGLVIFCVTPITNSSLLMKFRGKYIYTCLLIFPILSIVNLYCYFNDINYFMLDEDYDMKLNFSGLFPHPMWLAAATGLANQVFLWLFFTYKQKRKTLLATLFLVGFISSLYLTFIAASRVAVIASIISFIFMLYMFAKKKKTFVKYTAISIVALLLLSPILLKVSTRMIMKFEYSEGKYGSRTEFFQEGIDHFEDSPLLGTGYATQYIYGKRYVGRIESGSGWLSILFQLGIFGVISILLILPESYKTFKITRKTRDKKLILYESVFVFLCAHSCFEGYILTPGYYPCILFWTILGYLTAYPKFVEGGFERKYKILQKFEFEQKLLERRKAEYKKSIDNN